MSVSSGIGFRCMIRRRLLTVDRSPLLYNESSSTSAAVNKKKFVVRLCEYCEKESEQAYSSESEYHLDRIHCQRCCPY